MSNWCVDSHLFPGPKFNVLQLEYDNTEGMILLSELSRRRIRSVQKLIRVGRNEVVVVLRVDKEKGYIDLSKRRVSPEDIVKCEERYMKSKAVASILRHVASKIPTVGADGQVVPSAEPQDKESKRAARKARQAAQEDGEAVAAASAVDADAAGAGPNSNEEEKLEQLYDTVGWPLGRKYGHPYDAFKLALTCVFFFVSLIMTRAKIEVGRLANLMLCSRRSLRPLTRRPSPSSRPPLPADLPLNRSSCVPISSLLVTRLRVSMLSRGLCVPVNSRVQMRCLSRPNWSLRRCMF